GEELRGLRRLGRSVRGERDITHLRIIPYSPACFHKLSQVIRPSCQRGRIVVVLLQIRLTNMPSLLRFLMIVGVIGGIAYGAMFALATFGAPTPRDITVTVPQDRFLKR